MAAPFFSTPFQPYVYQSPQAAVTPFQILGGESQIVQIMLKSQEKITAKPGTMCYMSGSIQMDNIYVPENEGGLWQWLFGKSLTSIVFFNSGPDDGFVGIAAPSPARILPIDLAKFGGEIICQPDAFLCSVNDVTVTSISEQRPRNVVFGTEILLKQRLSGQGLAFLVAGGSVVQKILDVDEVLVVDTACIVAMTTTISFQLKHTNPTRRIIFGGESQNQLTAVLTGPGIIFVQSLPFPRLSQRIARSVTSPNLRENPKFFAQIVTFLFLAYVIIVASLVLTDV
ncbi:putative mitochondrial biogenesis protein AIM24 [Dioscorea sansibarensis]